MSRFARSQERFAILTRFTTFFYLLVMAFAAIWAGVRALQWQKTPFIGAFVEHTLVLNGVGPMEPGPEWELYRLEHQFGPQIVAINGEEVPDDETYYQILRQFHPGETVVVTLEYEDGRQTSYPITLHRFPRSSQLTFFVVPYFLGLVFLLIAWWVFLARQEEVAGRIFTWLSASLGIIALGLFSVYTDHSLTYLWVFSLGMTAATFIDLIFFFPQHTRLVIRYPWVRAFPYLVAAALVIRAYPSLFNYELPRLYAERWAGLYAYAGLAALTFLGGLVLYALFSSSPIIRSQARMVLGGSVLAFAPLLAWIGWTTVRGQAINFSPFLLFPFVFFPAALAYSILRYRLLRADYLLSRTLFLMALGAFSVLGYAAMVSGLGLLSQSVLHNYNLTGPFISGLLILVLALLFLPLRARMERIIDDIFFRNQQVYEARLQQFAHDLTGTLDLNGITNALRKQVIETLSPDPVHVYIYDPATERYIAMPDEQGVRTSDVTFPRNSPLVQWLRNEHLPLYIADETFLPAPLEGLSTRLALLQAVLFVAIPGQEDLNGWLAVGVRLSGDNYSSNDINFLENLCTQTALAVERVQSVNNLQRRLQELNALTRVAQGVNITLEFDDILELIYAQTYQIIPVDDLHITLYDENGDYYYYAFCLENSERLNDRENKRLPVRYGLEPWIIQTGQSILTNNYLQTCQEKDVMPATPDAYAWIGVPLNTGTRTIGALSIGHRDPSMHYTQSQLSTLKSIADLTAGAIVKSQLLYESEQRARQLASLNTITQRLTSTLDISTLLDTIVKSAVQILDSEAGSLLLLDEETDELVFDVTFGPVAEDLRGTRIARGVGFVGRAVETRRPVIVNDAQRTGELFGQIDNQTGFITRNLIAVPLIYQDKVIGVLEVINRRDGSPYTTDDSSLLEAFAGQAAVAIQNARLYTLTDKALSDRVEELSVMQRIDRELNASLDVTRAMRITLEWALKQSGADAGFIGVLDEENQHLRIMAQDGYGDALQEYEEQPMEIEQESLRLAIETTQPQKLLLDSSRQELGYLSNVQTQIVVPIKRETKVIGLFVLESARQIEDEVLEFLIRLSDHAAIAIANAQLFEAVERANAAKTDFISFVAHELKNPMTSIKGYTDLLAKGAVGPVNEMQANFLKTISANVERMATLVSDLNDNSKIEAGRLHLDFTTVSMHDVIEDAVRSMKQQMEEKEQTIELQVPAELPPVWADQTRISQVMVNLISNAYKYTPQGGHIVVGAEVSENIWDPEGAAQVVHIWVKDNGIGIKPEDQKKIFQKFFRSDDEKAREASGTGLGLNITKGLVELQGGKIWFESEYRQGTTFHFTVPVVMEEEA